MTDSAIAWQAAVAKAAESVAAQAGCGSSFVGSQPAGIVGMDQGIGQRFAHGRVVQPLSLLHLHR